MAPLSTGERWTTMPTKRRKMSYLRPSWINDPGLTLESAIRAALYQLPNVVDTRFPLGLGLAETRHRSVTGNAIYLHIATWTPEEATPTVPHVIQQGADEDLSSQPAGLDWDYLDGDGMVLVADNHCIVVPSGIRIQAIERYLCSLLGHARDAGASLPRDIDRFMLVPIANETVAEQIRQQGPKKIELNLGQYLETARSGLDRARTTIWRNIGRGLLELLVQDENDRQKIEEAENVNARLTITLDGRRAGLEPSDLAPVAEHLVADSEDDDDIVIETATGERIQKGRLALARHVNIDAFHKTVHYNSAWEAMREYYGELADRGALDE